MGFSAEQVMGIVSLLLVLAVWVNALRNQRSHNRWLDNALLRREEELQRKKPKPKDEPLPQDKDKSSGPWG